MCSFVRLSVCALVGSFVCSYVFVCPLVRLFDGLLVFSFVRVFVCSIVSSLVCLFARSLFVCVFNCS